MIIDRWKTILDAGGAGLHCGGDGVDETYRFLEASTIAIHADRTYAHLPVGRQGRRTRGAQYHVD